MKSSFDNLLIHSNSAAALKKISKVLSLDASSVEAQVVKCDTVGGKNTHELVPDLIPYYRGAVLKFKFMLSFNEPLAEDCAVALFSNYSTDRPFTAIETETLWRRWRRVFWKTALSPMKRHFPRVHNLVWPIFSAWLRDSELDRALGTTSRLNLPKFDPDRAVPAAEMDGEMGVRPLEVPRDTAELGLADVRLKEASYMLSDASLARLRSAGVPPEVLKLLAYLANQVFRGEENFLRVLRTVLASGEHSQEAAEQLVEKYREKIFQAAEKRFDTALYEKFFIEKDKPNYSISMNLNSGSFSPAYLNDEAVWILLKPRNGVVHHLGLKLPDDCINNMVYLKAEPAYLYIDLEADNDAPEIEHTIEFYRSDKEEVRIIADPRMEKPSFVRITPLSARAVSVKFDLDAVQHLQSPETDAFYHQLRFLDELSQKHLDITVPLRIVRRRRRRQKSLRR